MDDVKVPHQIVLIVTYVDEHLIELEAVVDTGHWRGRASAYAIPQEIATFAVELQRFADGAANEAELATGADNGSGLLAMRFYRVDRAGHIACHVRLATGKLPGNHRPEEVCRLSIEVQTETWAVIQFARQLSELARTQVGQASLHL